jgi:alginate O-acetyltransferase complex protein AlgJ
MEAPDPPPEHSLPSYQEPTPETHRHISREEEAEQALKTTSISHGTARVLVALFLLTLASGALLQIAAGRRLPFSALERLLPTHRAPLPHPAEIKKVEKEIEQESVFSRWVLPRVQSILTGDLGAGNEQAYLGQPGWLFYRPDVEYVTGPPFLDPARLRHRVREHRAAADPIPAIVDFQRQLKARGIELILLPASPKSSVEAAMLAPGASPGGSLQNPSFVEWLTRLRAAGVRVFDPASLPQHYLETDTHWDPATMEAVAQALATTAQPLLPTLPARPQLRAVPQEIENLGDIAVMLKLPSDQQLFHPQHVTIRQVQADNALWRPNRAADVLLLGDSFSNIYSLLEMGWGESAGLAEHLSLALGRPLDCILRNSDGAFATRELLSRELARGSDRLAGKKVVIWEFAQRELAIGDWKLLPLAVGHAPPSQFFTPAAGEHPVITGTVEAISSVPRPHTVPYRDHIATVHLSDVTIPGHAGEGFEVLASVFTMQNNVWTAAARLRPGDRVTLQIRPWSEVSAQYEKINRSELDDPALQLEEPVWAEPAPDERSHK